MSEDSYAVKWLRSAFNVECSPLGAKVADLLNEWYDGIYHLDLGSLRKVDWTNERGVRITMNDHGGFPTFDSNKLTRLVVLCHDHCLRCELAAAAHGYFWLTFWERKREGRVFERHPTIEEAITMVRSK